MEDAWTSHRGGQTTQIDDRRSKFSVFDLVLNLLVRVTIAQNWILRNFQNQVQTNALHHTVARRMVTRMSLRSVELAMRRACASGWKRSLCRLKRFEGRCTSSSTSLQSVVNRMLNLYCLDAKSIAPLRIAKKSSSRLTSRASTPTLTKRNSASSAA